MTDSTKSNSRSTQIDDNQFPLGLSSRQFAVLVIAGAVILPGLLVYVSRSIGLSIFGDLIWIIGYGTGIFVAWYLWIRPLNLVGAVEQDTSSAMEGGADDEQE